MEELIRSIGRTPRQRTTLYADVTEERRDAARDAAPLADPVNPPANESRLPRPEILIRPGLIATT
jgi:FO synthase